MALNQCISVDPVPPVHPNAIWGSVWGNIERKWSGPGSSAPGNRPRGIAVDVGEGVYIDQWTRWGIGAAFRDGASVTPGSASCQFAAGAVHLTTATRLIS